MTTTSQAASNGKPKQAAVGYNVGEIQKLRDMVRDLLSQYFPKLSQAPNILYVIMATLGFESGWKLLHSRGNKISSMHNIYVPGSEKPGSAVREYLISAPIQHVLRSSSVTPEIVQNVYQGCVAHGMSAIMGHILVAGTPSNKYRFSGYRNIVTDLGLEVRPGESITNLFQANDDLAKKRSIACCIIHIDGDYDRALNKGSTRNEALVKAIGYYLGSPKVADKNGMTPEQRISDITSGKKGVNYALQVAGVTMNGEAFVANSQVASNTTAASNDSNRVASTTSTKQPSPGCSST